jgi:hypothetical protein
VNSHSRRRACADDLTKRESEILQSVVRGVLATWDIRSKKRENDSSTYFFSLLFQYQAGGDKIFCMAVYSPVLDRIPPKCQEREVAGKKFLSNMGKNNAVILGTHPLQVFLQ